MNYEKDDNGKIVLDAIWRVSERRVISRSKNLQ